MLELSKKCKWNFYSWFLEGDRLLSTVQSFSEGCTFVSCITLVVQCVHAQHAEKGECVHPGTRVID